MELLIFIRLPNQKNIWKMWYLENVKKFELFKGVKWNIQNYSTCDLSYHMQAEFWFKGQRPSSNGSLDYPSLDRIVPKSLLDPKKFQQDIK